MQSKQQKEYRLNLVIDWNAFAKNYNNADTAQQNLKQWMSKCGFVENKPNTYFGEYEEKLFWIVNTLMRRSPKIKPYIKHFTYHIQNEMGVDEDDVLASYDKA